MTGPDPAAPGADLEAALAAHRAGDVGGARAAYRRHLGASPEDARAWCALASLEGQAGRHGEAEEAYRKAAAASPSHAPAHAGLGMALLMQDRPGEAAAALARAHELAPGDEELGLQLALAHRQAGDLPRAIAVLEALARPERHRVRYNLGLARLEAGDAAGAARTLDALAREAGPRPQVLTALGRALAALNRLDEAATALEDALARAPGYAAARSALAGVQRLRGRLGEAERLYREVLEEGPGRPPAAIAGLAEVKRLQGDPEAGLAMLGSLDAEEARVPQAVTTEAKLLLAAGRPADAAARIEARLAGDGLSGEGRAGLASLHGRALDQLGRYEEAWEAWTAAVADRRGDFDPNRFAAAIERVAAAYDRHAADAAAGTESKDGPAPLLLVGAPRSGKSILEQMLACHPRIAGGGELRLLGGLTESARRRDPGAGEYPDCIGRLDGEALDALSGEYARGLAAVADDAGWVTDTQPTNFLHLGLAFMLHPGARAVHCRRATLDLAWACYGRRFADPALAFVATPGGIAAYLRGLERLMGHWQALWPDRVMELRYEDLVTDPEAEIRRALGFLGLPFSESCLEYWKPGRARLSSPPAVTHPVDRGEIGRGEPYRERLGAALGGGRDGDHGR